MITRLEEKVLNVAEKNVYSLTTVTTFIFLKLEDISTYQLSAIQVIDILYHSGGFRLLQADVYHLELAE